MAHTITNPISALLNKPLHRIDGPAVTLGTGQNVWWVSGIQLTAHEACRFQQLSLEQRQRVADDLTNGDHVTVALQRQLLPGAPTIPDGP